MGQLAARKFGVRNQDHVAVAYALAGASGSATDWLDTYVAHGAEAVRAGILAAVAFSATAEEIEKERVRVEGQGEIARVTSSYPLPDLDGMTLAYQRTKTGKVWVHMAVKVGDSVEMVPVASPFGVLARLRFADDDDAYGLRLVVEDMGGRVRGIDVDRATFARQGAADTRSMLFGAGLRTEGDGEHIAVKCLKAADPQREIAVVLT